MTNKEGLAAAAELGPCPGPAGLALWDRHAACGNAGAEPTTPRISIVIPALNEARNLPYVFASLPGDIYEVILVDGHSTDDTVAVARRLYPDVRVVRQTRRGKGNALACGFAACRGDIIVMVDADGSANGAEIPRFVAALQRGADFAKGSRFIRDGGSADITLVRRLGCWGLILVVNILYGTRYTDLCYGYNAFWAHCLPYIHVDCDGFEVETLINIRIAQAGLHVTEVPSFESPRIHGVSNLNPWRDGWRILKTIVTERYVCRSARASQPALNAELEQEGGLA
jgi:glycosyltransferase involved in cell wall biosynthesis